MIPRAGTGIPPVRGLELVEVTSVRDAIDHALIPAG